VFLAIIVALCDRERKNAREPSNASHRENTQRKRKGSMRKRKREERRQER
jgi:hypothetical protein